ncbi:MAG: SPASM domain-containing protein, partial [Betaproteobacteria bacterium]|nr:SPASM domain-containing protein [Betaproteobacteria bacterium]
LTLEINEWLEQMGFAIGLSHDGPGYQARGFDPLDDPEQRAAIMDLYARLHPQGRISINAMISSQNPSRAAVQLWLQERFGADVQIGEGAFIDPYDEGGLAATYKTACEHAAFRKQGFGELRAGLTDRFEITHQKIQDFIDSIRFARPASALGQKCGMDRSANLAVDLKGNVITCQNVSAAATAPNGQPHLIGQLSDLSAVRMKSATHWSQRQGCSSCPVLQICKGSCMFLEGPLWEAGCDAAYSDNLVFFTAAIEFLTGCMPIFIDGDLPPDRKDIFGLARAAAVSPGPRKVIPIALDQHPA